MNRICAVLGGKLPKDRLQMEVSIMGASGWLEEGNSMDWRSAIDLADSVLIVYDGHEMQSWFDYAKAQGKPVVVMNPHIAK